MQISLATPRARSGFRPSRPFVDWVLCWIGLASLPFCAVSLIVGPPRAIEIVGIGICGLILRRAPFWVRFPAFVALILASAVKFVAGIFHMPLRGLLHSVGFLAELRPAGSIEYLVAGALFAATIVIAYRLFRRPQDFVAHGELAAAAALLFAAAGLDYAVSSDNMGSYSRLAPPDAPFSSAVARSGFGAAKDDRHLVVVMVEALGVPRDPRLASQLMRHWRMPAITRAFDVTSGTSLSYGSTTSGEVRELCGRWGDYPALMDKRDETCLPARLAARGYATAAYHGFDDGLFERTDWYPNAGFNEMHFRESLFAQGVGRCPGVFPGACDRDIPALLGRRLKAADTPQFLYWLTLNSHVPVTDSRTLGTSDCARFDPALARDGAMVCRLFKLWDGTFAALATALADPALPRTDILIVGDHAPPFFDRSQRKRFVPGRVPWVLLRHKGSGSGR